MESGRRSFRPSNVGGGSPKKADASEGGGAGGIFHYTETGFDAQLRSGRASQAPPPARPSSVLDDNGNKFSLPSLADGPARPHTSMERLPAEVLPFMQDTALLPSSKQMLRQPAIVDEDDSDEEFGVGKWGQQKEAARHSIVGLPSTSKKVLKRAGTQQALSSTSVQGASAFAPMELKKLRSRSRANTPLGGMSTVSSLGGTSPPLRLRAMQMRNANAIRKRYMFPPSFAPDEDLDGEVVTEEEDKSRPFMRHFEVVQKESLDKVVVPNKKLSKKQMMKADLDVKTMYYLEGEFWVDSEGYDLHLHDGVSSTKEVDFPKLVEWLKKVEPRSKLDAYPLFTLMQNVLVRMAGDKLKVAEEVFKKKNEADLLNFREAAIEKMADLNRQMRTKMEAAERRASSAERDLVTATRNLKAEREELNTKIAKLERDRQAAIDSSETYRKDYLKAVQERKMAFSTMEHLQRKLAVEKEKVEVLQNEVERLNIYLQKYSKAEKDQSVRLKSMITEMKHLREEKEKQEEEMQQQQSGAKDMQLQLGGVNASDGQGGGVSNAHQQGLNLMPFLRREGAHIIVDMEKFIENLPLTLAKAEGADRSAMINLYTDIVDVVQSFTLASGVLLCEYQSSIPTDEQFGDCTVDLAEYMKEAMVKAKQLDRGSQDATGMSVNLFERRIAYPLQLNGEYTDGELFVTLRVERAFKSKTLGMETDRLLKSLTSSVRDREEGGYGRMQDYYRIVVKVEKAVGLDPNELSDISIVVRCRHTAVMTDVGHIPASSIGVGPNGRQEEEGGVLEWMEEFVFDMDSDLTQEELIEAGHHFLTLECIRERDEVPKDVLEVIAASPGQQRYVVGRTIENTRGPAMQSLIQNNTVHVNLNEPTKSSMKYRQELTFFRPMSHLGGAIMAEAPRVDASRDDLAGECVCVPIRFSSGKPFGVLILDSTCYEPFDSRPSESEVDVEELGEDEVAEDLKEKIEEDVKSEVAEVEEEEGEKEEKEGEEKEKEKEKGEEEGEKKAESVEEKRASTPPKVEKASEEGVPAESVATEQEEKGGEVEAEVKSGEEKEEKKEQKEEVEDASTAARESALKIRRRWRRPLVLQKCFSQSDLSFLNSVASSIGRVQENFEKEEEEEAVQVPSVIEEEEEEEKESMEAKRVRLRKMKRRIEKKLRTAKRSHLEEMRSYSNPPATVKRVVEAALLLLGDRSAADLEWREMRKKLQVHTVKPGCIFKMMEIFDPTGPEEGERERDYIDAENHLRDLTIAQSSSASFVSAMFHRWVLLSIELRKVTEELEKAAEEERKEGGRKGVRFA
eukprot:CAMPEP_0113895490 /NCGR_PEP_ID=MMETSP0780_2-20120614/17393_1 /TAXON_ID=652834 /ORGANISM="Palpitomonas bilix" /LENGTH=1301 /DNA_ID=CAMNT_0000886329 /DNA_START=255 /DNA_END=4160 /DNA_ORIENTATION=+ /assembly_acc=CAM_ASM_000599